MSKDINSYESQLDMKLWELEYQADTIVAGLLGLTVSEYTEEVRAKHDSLLSRGHRCLNPFECKKEGHECNFDEVYGP